MKQKPKRFSLMETREKAAAVAGALEEKQAMEVTALDVSGLTSVTDAIVIATAKNARHAKALADHLLDTAKEAGLEYFGMEGYRGGEWVLVDFNDVVVHVFQETFRGFYDLEGLWSDAAPISLDSQAKEDSGG